MAIKPKENEAFYREVDDELRRDRALETWERYRWPIIGGIVLLIAAIGGFIWWQNYRETRAQAQGEALTAVVEGMQTGAYRGTAPQIAELEKSGSDVYRGLGLISRANLLAQDGDTAGAARVLAQVAADEGVPQEVRNAALVRQTIIEYERLQPAQVIQRLRPLVQRGNPFHGTAGELTAHAHLRAQQAQQAGQVFKAIAEDDTVPESIRSRAVQMAGGLGIDATQDAPARGGGGAVPGGNAPAAPAPAAAPAAPATKE